MKIFLTGMPGCGKSTFGRKAAGELEMEFIDLDKEIVIQEGMLITDIFDSKGEDYFRQLESSLLKQVSQTHDNFIMATGGGAPCFFDNMDFMNEQGETVFIDTPIGIILERLSTHGISKRPLIKKMEQDNLYDGLAANLKQRLPFYKKAKVILSYKAALETDIIKYINSLG